MKRLLASLAALGLAACASTYDPESMTGGFSEEELTPTVWYVTYAGNGYTTNETVQTYWLYRAAELTLSKGYDGFSIVSARDRVSLGPSVDELVDEGLVGKPWISTAILMLKHPLQERPGITFDAAAVKSYLGPYVEGEKCGGNVCPHVPEYLYAGFAERVKTLPPPNLPAPRPRPSYQTN